MTEPEKPLADREDAAFDFSKATEPQGQTQAPEETARNLHSPSSMARRRTPASPIMTGHRLTLRRR